MEMSQRMLGLNLNILAHENEIVWYRISLANEIIVGNNTEDDSDNCAMISVLEINRKQKALSLIRTNCENDMDQ